MTEDPYNHIREAFHTVADGLMDWRDPPPSGRVPFKMRGADRVYRVEITRSDVEAIERLSDAAIRSRDTQTALAGYTLALRLRTLLQRWGAFDE